MIVNQWFKYVLLYEELFISVSLSSASLNDTEFRSVHLYHILYCLKMYFETFLQKRLILDSFFCSLSSSSTYWDVARTIYAISNVLALYFNLQVLRVLILMQGTKPLIVLRYYYTFLIFLSYMLNMIFFSFLTALNKKSEMCVYTTLISSFKHTGIPSKSERGCLFL